MTPKEKAVDIFYKYYQATKDHNIAKECTLIAIDAMIEELSIVRSDDEFYDTLIDGRQDYLILVEQEIKNL